MAKKKKNRKKKTVKKKASKKKAGKKAKKKATKKKTAKKTAKKAGKTRMKSKKTNSIGPGTENLAINMPSDIKCEIEKRASINKMKTVEYIRYILIDAVKRGVNIQRKITLTPTRSK